MSDSHFRSATTTSGSTGPSTTTVVAVVAGGCGPVDVVLSWVSSELVQDVTKRTTAIAAVTVGLRPPRFPIYLPYVHRQAMTRPLSIAVLVGLGQVIPDPAANPADDLALADA